MKKLVLAAMMAATAVSATTAMADPWHGHGHGRGHGYGHDRGYDRGDYDDRGYYRNPRRISRDDHVWRGRDGRYYCRRSNGTTGLIIGAAGGALVGRAIDTRGDRTMGTVLGAVGGGLLGREIDRGNARCR
ncbi:MAG TPA: glycine zipper 2TM domain-containing protein [Novosphingobium capsulatum]|nr:glycine zipper 2TM domain-containing protein [Novosphingobium capsulatum]